jgi:hypothetical protein
MTRIALSGAHRVGKSTLVRALMESRSDVYSIGNIMRDIIAAGLPAGIRTTPETLSVYLDRQLRSELLVRTKTNAAHVVSDRVLVDGVAYVLAAQKASAEHEYNWRPEELKFLRVAAKLHASRYDIHAYVPIEFAFDESDALDLGRELQEAVDAELQALLSDDWPIPVEVVRGTVAERVLAVSRFLD